MFQISQFHHASLIVNNTEISLRFYRDLLGLAVENNRPELGYPGAWLQVGDQQVHLLELPNPDPVDNRPQHGGRDRHLAFSVDDLSSLVETLEQGKIDFTLSKSGRKALFCRDPDGNALEFIEG